MMRRTARAYIFTLLAVALMAMGWNRAQADPPGDRRGGRHLVTILTPSSKATVDGPRVHLRVRVDPDVDPASFRATFNGRDITRQFAPALHGVRTAVAVPSQLQVGRNDLEVSVQCGSKGGRGLRRDKVKFKVRRLLAPQPEFANLGDTSSAAPLVPIATRIISGDGTEAADYGIQVGGALYTAPHPRTGASRATRCCSWIARPPSPPRCRTRPTRRQHRP